MNKIIIFFSSVFGVGYIKYAVGTISSLIGVLLWVLVVPCNYIYQIPLLIVIFIGSVLFSYFAEKIYNKKDDRRIVIDEISGMWFSVAFLPKTFGFLLLGFLLFRMFDVRKPFFINKIQKLKGGWGVTLDDILSGVLVNMILQIIRMVFQ
ncbi:MAG: phosphatidylglycerophosphatase A [Endomicrobium sp.]|jgi:phosphatidylglycerophosphatase A|nr:phosphatidylglycerophosphatase A [Endomicrobium sp.]